ncbi:34 kDa antigenic protein [Mycobacterium talmoniae]|uniref:34 kDa antigenic protein n=1 Tax=Mycobacterium talmoniae TaxID=1858794 RepID=A0A2S8BF54_9MYCO|nr:34 kDa antigenic protein [Mycobacterium talmoniae]
MSYRSGDQGYYSAERTGGYGAYQPSSARSDSSPPLPRYLSLGVVALGLASYLVSYGPVLGLADIGWGVRFAVLAALLAAFGLAPGQTPNAKVIAALAAAGFLDALSTLITAPDGSRPGWALTVIVVLNGLQAVAAVAALMLQAGVVGQRASQSEYDATRTTTRRRPSITGSTPSSSRSPMSCVEPGRLRRNRPTRLRPGSRSRPPHHKLAAMRSMSATMGQTRLMVGRPHIPTSRPHRPGRKQDCRVSGRPRPPLSSRVAARMRSTGRPHPSDPCQAGGGQRPRLRGCQIFRANPVRESASLMC